MLEKDRPQDDDLDYDYKRDGASVGYPTKLVQVDEQKSVIVIDPSDEKLQDKTYQIFITCHVTVNKAVQDKFYDYIPPFDITVVEKLEDFKPENLGPVIEDFQDSFLLEAGKSETITVGKPVDLEGDAFYVESWKIKDEGLHINWVVFHNETSQNSLEFTMSPP